jgi:hypothetical protein
MNFFRKSLAIDAQRHGECDPGGAAPFDSSIIRNLHGFSRDPFCCCRQPGKRQVWESLRRFLLL